MSTCFPEMAGLCNRGRANLRRNSVLELSTVRITADAGICFSHAPFRAHYGYRSSVPNCLRSVLERARPKAHDPRDRRGDRAEILSWDTRDAPKGPEPAAEG